MARTQVELWHTAAEAFDERHRIVQPFHHQLVTPCDGFDVEGLIEHAVDSQVRLGGFLGASFQEADSWGQVQTQMAAAVHVSNALEGVADHPRLGPTSKERLLAIATNDLLIHAWDLSRALGVDETLPAQNIEPAIQGIEAFPAEIRSLLFSSPIEVTPDAGAQTRMLAIAGRQV